MELLAALVLIGMVLYGFRTLLDQVTTTGRRVAEDSRTEDTRRNGERLLRAVLARADAGADSAERFTGDAGFASFMTWCDVPSGWMERCRVTVAVAREVGEPALLLDIPGEGIIPVLSLPAGAELRFFSTRAEDPWAESWGTSIRLPEALGVVLPGGDTITLSMGAY